MPSVTDSTYCWLESTTEHLQSWRRHKRALFQKQAWEEPSPCCGGATRASQVFLAPQHITCQALAAGR